MSEATYYKSQRSREPIPIRAKDYYKNDKERLREQARNNYRELSEESVFTLFPYDFMFAFISSQLLP